MNTSEDDINAVVEEALNAVEYLVLRCPKEIQSHVEAILKTAQSFISFDPNYNYDAADEAMEDGEDWGDEEDEWDEPGMDMNFDDDSSWKVRRSSIKVILAVIRSWPDYLRMVYDEMSLGLVHRFKERDDKI